jgi:hypothetical protein
MSFTFGKKKQDSGPEYQDEKMGSRLDKFQEELTVLEKDEMSKVEGGKSSIKSMSDLSDLSNSFGGPTPL